MRFQQIVHLPADLLRVQLGGGVRVEHDRLEDGLAVAGQRRVGAGFGLIGDGLAQALRPRG
jgi:hypothetical protein